MRRPATVRQWNGSRWAYPVSLAVLLALGLALRLYRFPAVPFGLQQDEISEVYESYCLLHTGADRWGIHLPAYFLGWGSGQNVLQAYLTVPVVAALGLTPLAARLVTLLCGLLSLPLFYGVVRRWHGDLAALLSLGFLCVCPWHVMLSRWGLECNPLPLFLLLGLYTFVRAVESRSTWVIVPSLVPFALALYAYGIVLVFLPVFLLLLAAMEWDAIAMRARAWLAALVLGVGVSAPIVWFVVKNYVTKRNYGFEQWLPFSIPLLPVTRLSEVRGTNPVLRHNLSFLWHGLQDYTTWNQVPHINPLPPLVLGLACVGIAAVAARSVRERTISEPFLPWLIAALPLLLIVPVKINEAICLFVPLLALAGVGFAVLLDAMPARPAKLAFAGLCAALLVSSTARFSTAYFGAEYASASAPIFHPDLPAALDRLEEGSAPDEPIYVTETILLNYVQVLFYRRVDPHSFQISGATWDHPEFGHYRFSRTAIKNLHEPFLYLLAPNDPAICAKPQRTATVGEFHLGECH